MPQSWRSCRSLADTPRSACSSHRVRRSRRPGRLTVDPARIGPNLMHVYLLEAGDRRTVGPGEGIPRQARPAREADRARRDGQKGRSRPLHHRQRRLQLRRNLGGSDDRARLRVRRVRKDDRGADPLRRRSTDRSNLLVRVAERLEAGSAHRAATTWCSAMVVTTASRARLEPTSSTAATAWKATSRSSKRKTRLEGAIGTPSSHLMARRPPLQTSRAAAACGWPPRGLS